MLPHQGCVVRQRTADRACDIAADNIEGLLDWAKAKFEGRGADLEEFFRQASFGNHHFALHRHAEPDELSLQSGYTDEMTALDKE